MDRGLDGMAVMLGVRLTPSQRRALEDAARRDGITLSELTRRALAEYLLRQTMQVFGPAGGSGLDQEVSNV